VGADAGPAVSLVLFFSVAVTVASSLGVAMLWGAGMSVNRLGIGFRASSLTAALGVALGGGVAIPSWTPPESVGRRLPFLDGRAEPWSDVDWFVYVKPYLVPAVAALVALVLIVVLLRAFLREGGGPGGGTAAAGAAGHRARGARRVHQRLGDGQPAVRRPRPVPGGDGGAHGGGDDGDVAVPGAGTRRATGTRPSGSHWCRRSHPASSRRPSGCGADRPQVVNDLLRTPHVVRYTSANAHLAAVVCAILAGAAVPRTP
jgi:hypothetical protein